MKTIKSHALPLVLALAVVLSVSPHDSFGAATIVINNLDGPGEGFNDPTIVAPVGGNPSNTLGGQRLFAFTYAANLIGQCLMSNVTIVVDANMDPLFCNATSAVLLFTFIIQWPLATIRSFPGAPSMPTMPMFS